MLEKYNQGKNSRQKVDPYLASAEMRSSGNFKLEEFLSGNKLHLISHDYARIRKQVAQWATIAHLGASTVVGDTIIYDTQRQVTLNLKQ